MKFLFLLLALVFMFGCSDSEELSTEIRDNSDISRVSKSTPTVQVLSEDPEVAFEQLQKTAREKAGDAVEKGHLREGEIKTLTKITLGE